MSKETFRVKISPQEALAIVKDRSEADLIHDEMHDLGQGKCMGTLVFEKYYFRAKNRAALVVIIDNLQNSTEVRVVAAGSSQGLLFNFDWGAADDFAYSVREILSEYVIDEQ